MAERTEQNTARTNNPRNRNESHLGSAPGRASSDDDVIATLANAPENRRARQVTEWERVGVRTMFRA